MVELNSPEDLVLSKTGMNDIDVSAVSWDVKDYLDILTQILTANDKIKKKIIK